MEVDDILENYVYLVPKPLGSPMMAATLVEAQKSNWLEDVVGSKIPMDSGVDSTFSSRPNGPIISLPYFVVDSIFSSFTLSLVVNFISFWPMVDMVRKWCLLKWN